MCGATTNLVKASLLRLMVVYSKNFSRLCCLTRHPFCRDCGNLKQEDSDLTTEAAICVEGGTEILKCDPGVKLFGSVYLSEGICIFIND